MSKKFKNKNVHIYYKIVTKSGKCLNNEAWSSQPSTVCPSADRTFTTVSSLGPLKTGNIHEKRGGG